MSFRRKVVSLLIAFSVLSSPLASLAQVPADGHAEQASAESLLQVDMLEVAKRAFANTPPPDDRLAQDAEGSKTIPAESPVALPLHAEAPQPAEPALMSASRIDKGDTAWMMVATIFVFLMTLPGVALFYGGMVRKKNLLGIMAQSFGAMAVVSLAWITVGYSIAFTEGNGFIGNASRLFLYGVATTHDGGTTVHPLAPTVPEPVFVMYEMMFAVIATALVVGAFAERVKFSATLLFCGLWSILVYAPIAHMSWMPNGYFARIGALDFAGGNVVHVAAGFAGLLCAYWIGPRKGYGREVMAPNHLGLTLVGGAMLAVGWFGFNAGSAFAADGRAAMAMLVTHVAAVSGALTWAAIEFTLRNRASSLGIVSGAIAGLVAITPASGYIGPHAAIIFGVVAALVGYWGATTFKRMMRCDDSLDVFGIHGLCGLAGGLLTGIFADSNIGGAESGIFAQMAAIAITVLYTLCMTYVVLLIVKATVGIRLSPVEEEHGLDMTQHGEIVE